MIFNSKQLEELENIHDSTGAFEEEADDEAGFDEVGEAAMDWRRGLIEEAAENVKRAKTRPVEPHIQYDVGSMLFDREEKRFARVQRSVPGYLKIVYLAGGDREFGTLDITGYLREVGAEKRVSELALQLGIADSDVALELDRLGITPLEEPEVADSDAQREPAPAPAAQPPLAKARKPAAPVVEDEQDADDEADEVDEAVEAVPAPERPVGGKAPKKPAQAAKPAAPSAPPASAASVKPSGGAKAQANNAPAAKAAKPSPARKPAPPPTTNGSGKGVNPIDDPNGYIKAHFQEMSNRELARLTGLSEHTIRRKLGEWSLKRKKEA